jgi:hypothetical protein
MPFGEPTLHMHSSPLLKQFVLPGGLASPPPPSVPTAKQTAHDVARHAPRSGCAAASVPHDCAPPAQLASESMQLDASPQQVATCPAHARARHAPHAVSSPEKWHASLR